jgi:malonyl-CoA/methylmalonyl-CoA synthetase
MPLLTPHLKSGATFLETPGSDPIAYDAFLAMTARYAHALNALGARTGDRLVLQVEKSVAALAVYAACIRAGIVFVPLNTAYQAEELPYFITDAAPVLMVCDPAAHPVLAPIAQTAGAQVLTMDADGSGTLADAAKDHPAHYDNVARGPDDLAAFLYTSGTTGRSKGAVLTHDNLLSNARALTTAWRFTDRDVLLHALPIFHAHGLFVACNVTLAAGGEMIFLPRFEIESVLTALPRATLIYANI